MLKLCINKIFFAGFLSLVILNISSLKAQQRNNDLKYTGFFDSYYYNGPLNFSVGSGITGYHGDLCNSITCMQPSFNYSIGANYNMFARLVFGGEINYYKLNGKGRFFDFDYNFNSTNWQINAYTRFYLLYDVVRRSGHTLENPKTFKPFISAGASLMYYNYEFNSNIQLVDSLISEENSPYYQLGKKNYPAFGFSAPIGIGTEIRILPEVSIVPELRYHFTLTDFLDDMPLKKNTYNFDGYYMFNLKIEITPWPKSVRKIKRSRPKYKHGTPSGKSDKEKTNKAPEEGDVKPEEQKSETSEEDNNKQEEKKQENTGNTENQSPDNEEEK